MTYEPTSRRPIAGLLRRTANAATQASVRFGIHPDTISYASLVAALGAGLCFWASGARPWLLIPAVLLCFFRLWCNMLDGMVALAGGTASRRGEILNEVPDRFSDVAIFVGVAESGLCWPAGGYAAAIAALLVAYVGTLGQAIGNERQFGGLMSKPWRMVVLAVGALATLAVLKLGTGQRPSLVIAGRWSSIDAAHLLILIGAIQTVWLRLRLLIRDLETEA